MWVVVGLIGLSLTVGGAVSTAQTAVPVSAAPSGSPAPEAPAFDHTLFDDLLRAHVKDGLVDYDGFAKAPAFARYLTTLQEARLDGMTEDERLAFWINAYNAYTIQLIVANDERESIRNINKTLGVLRLKGPWSAPIVRAAGRQLSLDDVLHTILRREFAEPRVLFAISCAAMSGAPLRSEAYTGAKLVDQLNEQGRLFLRESPTKNHVRDNVFFISPVITAYRNDFGASRAELLRFVAPWFDGADRDRLNRGRMLTVDTPFDWALNSQTKEGAQPARRGT